MKTLSAPVLAALASGSVAIATLIKLDFAGTPVYLNTSTWNLVWQRRYNLLTYSQEFDNSVIWLVSNLSVTPNAASAPDGTMTADLCTTFGPIANFSQIKPATAATMTFSVYVKADTADYVWLDIYNYATGLDVGYGVFTFATGVGTGGMVVVPLEDGWFRLSLTASGLGVGDNLGVYPGVTGSTYPVGMSWYTWGAQLEPGDLVSTYTATTTTALTETGETYLGAYGLGQISAIADKPGEAAGITLELHGADAARISLALDDADIVQGTPCTIRTAIIDTATYTILDAPIEWVGKLDTMAIGEDGTSATIGVTAESAAVDLLRGNAWTFTDADQRIVNAADASFSYVLDQIDKPIVWPTKAFFYK